MSITELDRLMKILIATASDDDEIAISAIRMANKILKQNKETWESVIALIVSVQPPTDSEKIDAVLAMQIKYKTRCFLVSLRGHLTIYGLLTENQKVVLDSIWEEHKANYK